MQGTWENGRFVLASTKDDKISRLERENAALRQGLLTACNELDRAVVVTDGHPSISHNLRLNLRNLANTKDQPRGANTSGKNPTL